MPVCLMCIPLYPSNAVGVPAAAYVPDIKALDRGSLRHRPSECLLAVLCVPSSRSSTRDRVFAGRGERLENQWSDPARTQEIPLTAFMGTDNSLTGLSQDRAQRDFTKPAYSSQAGGSGFIVLPVSLASNWLNNAAFSVPVQNGVGTGFGNVVKGTLRGPAVTTNWDASVVRSFPMYRESTMEFRAEYFDVLNHTILGNPNTANPVSSSTSFGTITSTQGGPRIAQFSLKLMF